MHPARRARRVRARPAKALFVLAFISLLAAARGSVQCRSHHHHARRAGAGAGPGRLGLRGGGIDRNGSQVFNGSAEGWQVLHIT